MVAVTSGETPKPPAQPDEARWIPVGALPIDLQLAVRETSAPVRARDFRPSMSAQGGLWGAPVALAVGLVIVLVQDDVPAFGSFWRVACLVVGAVLAARYLVLRRGLGFRSNEGQQMILGDGSLVIADTRSVRVIPAEAVSFLDEKIKYRSEIVASLDGNWRKAEWPARLREVVERAKTNPDVRRGDRFRQAAARARPVSPLLVGLSSRQPHLLATGLALSGVVFLEAGPIEARSAKNRAMNAEAAVLAKDTAGAADLHDRTIAAATSALAAKKRERLLHEALGQGMDEARAFLVAYGGDEARPLVQARLRELCAAKDPVITKPVVDSKAEVLRALNRGACETPRGGVYYYAVATTGDPNADVARTFMEDLAASAVKNASRPTVLETGAKGGYGPGYDPAGYPFTRLTMRLVSVAWYQWEIAVAPLDDAGQPPKPPVAPWVFRGRIVARKAR